MWKYFYDAFLQFLTTSWASYLTKNAAQGRLVRDVFFNNIYQWSGIILFLGCLLSCLLYYFYFNKRFGSYYTKRSWFKFMFITSLLIGIVTFLVGRSFVSSFICPTAPLVAWISVINFFYAIFLFFILSVICQLVAVSIRRLFAFDLSPMGSRTPF
jgi:hypothetical protein